MTANAYVGAGPVVEAMQRGADIVITGRLADPSLTVAPCIAHFGWSADDYRRIAGARSPGISSNAGRKSPAESAPIG